LHCEHADSRTIENTVGGERGTQFFAQLLQLLLRHIGRDAVEAIELLQFRMLAGGTRFWREASGGIARRQIFLAQAALLAPFLECAHGELELGRAALQHFVEVLDAPAMPGAHVRWIEHPSGEEDIDHGGVLPLRERFFRRIGDPDRGVYKLAGHAMIVRCSACAAGFHRSTDGRSS
jgi:hypothetical protein